MSENEDNTWKRDWEKGMTEIREQIAEMNRMYIKNSTEWELRHSRMVEHENQMDKRQDRTQQHLDHITKLIGVVFDDLDNVGEGLENTGKFLSYKRNR
jgi:uncharacterized protein YyaL (SSP411 family)